MLSPISKEELARYEEIARLPHIDPRAELLVAARRG